MEGIKTGKEVLYGMGGAVGSPAALSVEGCSRWEQAGCLDQDAEMILG